MNPNDNEAEQTGSPPPDTGIVSPLAVSGLETVRFVTIGAPTPPGTRSPGAASTLPGNTSGMETVRFTAGGSPAPAATFRTPGEGTTVFNRYLLKRVLGRGGMGVVWLAEDTKLERVVALKFLPDIIGTDPTAIRDLKDETRHGLELAHPNIVRIYDFVDDLEAVAISMEYVDGKTLTEHRLAKPARVFSPADIAPWMRELCDALDYAHNHCRLVHRDLKPANMMISSASRLKVTDFGIARSLSDTMSRVTNSTSGTLLYMSPQQAMGERPRPTDDIYSVGATIFELLTGKPPFYRGDVPMQLASKTAPTLRERREELEIALTDDIPDEWEEAVKACLAKDPAERPQSAGELASLLGLPIREDTKPLTIRTRPPEPKAKADPETAAPAKTAARLPLWAKAVIAGSVLTILLTLFFILRSNRYGEWEVQTNPPGAIVTLGDQSQLTPARFTQLKPGNYQATIAKEGFETRRVEFRVAAGDKVDLGIFRLLTASGQVAANTGESDGFEVKDVNASALPPQPDLPPPLQGFWNIDELLAHSEYKSYSENGRRRVLHMAQTRLAGIGYFQGETNGKEGKDFYEALQLFQTDAGLKPTGLLDHATVHSLKLTSLTDMADWSVNKAVTEKKAQAGWWQRNISGPIKSFFSK